METPRPAVFGEEKGQVDKVSFNWVEFMPIVKEIWGNLSLIKSRCEKVKGKENIDKNKLTCTPNNSNKTWQQPPEELQIETLPRGAP